MKGHYLERRIGAAVVLAVMLLSAVNHLMEWRWFEPFDRTVMVGMFVLGFLYYVFVGPTMGEMLDRQAAKVPDGRLQLRPRVYVLTVVVVMLLVALVGPVLRVAKEVPFERGDWIVFAIVEAGVIIAGLLGWYGMRRFLRGKSSGG